MELPSNFGNHEDQDEKVEGVEGPAEETRRERVAGAHAGHGSVAGWSERCGRGLGFHSLHDILELAGRA